MCTYSLLMHVQSGGEVKQLGLIFMSEADANALIEKVRAPFAFRACHTSASDAAPHTSSNKGACSDLVLAGQAGIESHAL